MMRTVFILAVGSAIALQAMADDAATAQIKPESYVKFPKSAVACLTKEDLGKIIQHFAKGENTKAGAMMNSKDNANGGCIMLSDKNTYKVLSAEYNDPESPELGLIEIVGKGSKSADGAWTFSMFAVPSVK